MSTLKVDTILKRTGTGTITVGQSGDTISVPTGATLSVSGSASGLPDNTPSFLVTISGTQSISTSTHTKVQFNSEVYDTDNTFDSSTNYRFTPAVAGKYQLSFGTLLTSLENDEKLQLQIRKNGSALDYDPSQRFYSTNSGGETVTGQTNLVVESDADDYFEAWIFHTEGGSRDIGQYSYFSGYKLIGA